MKKQYFNTNNTITAIRVFLGLDMVMHGLARLYYDSIIDFGLFLDSKGIPFGLFFAWSITLFDVAGGFFFALGYQLKCIGFIFIFILLSGILMAHIQNGWFVVGHSNGGIEYSILLILCFTLCIIHTKWNKETIEQ
ncbi:DoxX family protein [Flavobacterium sedimenticola]|uniref:DoxX family protein n=1 Tax=Flavobacterium sedimenticola TaxID=3043286 RepID=A0ABT6XS52_9FLAO|nr:DoxX family protein [Flavobacterium sedimenticola]MDI9257881.1 DoxX family protein [Flavobacterium sedimenticola]